AVQVPGDAVDACGSRLGKPGPPSTILGLSSIAKPRSPARLPGPQRGAGGVLRGSVHISEGNRLDCPQSVEAATTVAASQPPRLSNCLRQRLGARPNSPLKAADRWNAEQNPTRSAILSSESSVEPRSLRARSRRI